MIRTQSRQTKDAAEPAPKLARENAFIEQVGPTVMAILRHKSGMGLDIHDSRSDNLDALELYHDVMAKLWERLSWAGPGVGAVDDVRAYAAGVTHNAWSDYLRHKYPNRTSLKNRLSYFLNHEPGYLIWSDAGGERVAARGDSLAEATSRTRVSADHPRLSGLRLGIDRLPADALPGRAFDRLHAGDWRKLLSAVFAHVRGTICVDDLVSVCAALLSVHEGQAVSIEEGLDLPGGQLAPSSRDPHNEVQTRSMLRRLWVLVQQLPINYRLAYLLNIPGPGKSRGDIEVLLLDGVTTMDQIESALDLDDVDYQLFGDELDGVEPSAVAPVYPGGPSERFVQLWHHLPLSDALIARLTGLQPQQVINRRMLALRRLARGFGLDRRKERSRG